MSHVTNMTFGVVGDTDDLCKNVSMFACVPFQRTDAFTLLSHTGDVFVNQRIQSEQKIGIEH